MISRNRTFYVRQQLLVTTHHFLVVEQLEIDFNHLFQCFKAPFSLFAILQIEHFLK